MRVLQNFLASACIAVVCGAASAHAAIIDPISYTGAGCLGAASCVVNGQTVTAGPNGAELSEQDFRGVRGLGVAHLPGAPASSANDNELQGGINGGDGETIRVEFDMARVVSEIVLAHLYNPAEFSADPQEVAIITGFNGAGASQQLIIRNNDNSPTGFDVIGDAMVVRISTDGGTFSITDLFPALGPLTSLLFEAGSVASGDNSDYSIASIVVPLPGAALIMLSGVAGLGFAARRRRRKA